MPRHLIFEQRPQVVAANHGRGAQRPRCWSARRRSPSAPATRARDGASVRHPANDVTGVAAMSRGCGFTNSRSAIAPATHAEVRPRAKADHARCRRAAAARAPGSPGPRRPRRPPGRPRTPSARTPPHAQAARRGAGAGRNRSAIALRGVKQTPLRACRQPRERDRASAGPVARDAVTGRDERARRGPRPRSDAVDEPARAGIPPSQRLEGGDGPVRARDDTHAGAGRSRQTTRANRRDA